MNLFNALQSECIQVGVKSSEKEGILREIAQLSKQSDLLSHISEDQIFEGLEKREKLGSTGFGEGIAIPHCRLPNVDTFVVGLIVCKEGVDFQALDKNPTSIIVFMVGPEDKANDHLHLLSEISQTLNIPGAMEELLAENHPEAIKESFLRHVLDELEENEKVEHVQMTVTIQKEDLFDDILQIFAAMSTCSASVINGHDEREFLNKVPLFSGFFSDDEKGFHRIIMAVVQKQLANETVRQIDKVAGGLSNTQGVMVVVQDIFYVAGRLDS